ncbi:MAG: dUTP diphosphatase [Pseudomonadota bacterium]
MTTVRLAWADSADQSLGFPVYASAGAAGADLRANFAPTERKAGRLLRPGNVEAVPTGLRMEIPPGFEVQVRPRSGLALRAGVTLTNTPGTIDSDYRGEVLVLLHKVGSGAFRIRHGDRIAQMVVAPVVQVRFEQAEALGASERGAGGFGSTGRS